VIPAPTIAISLVRAVPESGESRQKQWFAAHYSGARCGRALARSTALAFHQGERVADVTGDDGADGARSPRRGSGASPTPAVLARELGVSPSTVRAWLRRSYTRPDGERRWLLTPEQVAAARRRWGSKASAPMLWDPRRRPPGEAMADAADDALLLTARRTRRRQHRGRARVVVLAAGLVALIPAVVAAAAAVAGGRVLARPLLECDLASPRPLALGQSSFLYAADGSALGAIPSERNRQPVSLRQISPWLRRATIAVEDRRFWTHGALDLEGIVRAAVANLRAGRIVQGGSTITQQLARNLYLGTQSGATLERKLREICLARKLGQRWTKRRILVAYLNHVFYGNRAYGVEAAAWTYFSRPARKLDLAESALVAGLPQAPSLYDPFRRPAAALSRRNLVLRSMLDSGFITTGQYRDAVRRPLGLEPGRRYARMREPDFFRYVQRELARSLGPEIAQDGGLRVETTVDPGLQALARRAMAAYLDQRSDPAVALVAIDPSTGAIRAMTSWIPIGRRLQFALPWQGRRLAGSAAKVFTLTAALEGGIPLSSVWTGPSAITIPDRRCLTGIDEPWRPHNYGDASEGTMTLLDALARSVNTIFAQVVAEVGPDRVVRMAHRLGIRSPLKPVCSITLGSQAVSPLEMTVAFATLAARGVRHDPQAIALVRAPDGRMLGRLQGQGRRAVSPQVADQVTYALQRVVTSGTGTAAALGRPVAGKTGTAEEYWDAWFCGYVPQLAACVWVGYPRAEIPLLNVGGFAQVFGGSIPALVWREFMAGALAGVDVRDFPAPLDSTSDTAAGRAEDRDG
jgi:penicillin-binding protein 1A